MKQGWLTRLNSLCLCLKTQFADILCLEAYIYILCIDYGTGTVIDEKHHFHYRISEFSSMLMLKLHGVVPFFFVFESL